MSAAAPAPADLAGRCLRILARIREDGGRLRDDEADILRELAAAAAEHSVALRSVIDDWLTAACQVWPEVPEQIKVTAEGHSPGGCPPALEAIRDMTVALTEGYETGHRAAIRREEAMRREFVDDLLDGRTGLGQLAERAERFALRLAGLHTVAVARAATAFRAGDVPTRYVEDAMTAAFSVRDVFITTKDSLLVCVASASEADVPARFAAHVGNAGARGCQVAVSRPRPGPSGIVRSYQEARSTLDLADRLGLDSRVVDASSLLVFQVLGRDRAAITDLVATVLGALEAGRGGPRPLLETLTAYFSTGCVNTTTAHRLGVSVRTVSYRLARIRQLTGYDPTDPDQRYILQTATLGARLLGWPSQPLENAD
ncbi:helix-turn-helix domain-containing protein [Streptomyces ficellus]|uniref:Helix-turn-helix domain-containing protein n=1 Tax=Streptomyces ficellus TaxID=1977088 RepID=A0ABT7Z3D3_9ACTN|nr:helix-turn-helix domain-containing protein [Streptomyces ficellus]MDN3294002.1 helix-turn-helix domain-containing protein [Streptomyces ficellus]